MVKVLLVEDDPDLVDVTSYALRREGFNVIVAGTGQQALQRWEADRPDLVVLDVGLPQLNGFEAFPLFAAAVIVAQILQAPQARIDILALVFVAARVA